jgi:phenylacetic acid degradation operon negative regulatory protein
MNEQLRKRAIGVPAARSLLLTVLGEYVLPLEQDIWQETLVGALTTLGYSQQAARQAVARSVRDGWLTTERQGRRARMALSGSTRVLLETGAQRIYSFGAATSWDGRWLIVVLRVPEENRAVRHQLRSGLAWAGFGSLGGGIWLTPHVDREREVKATVQEEPLAEAVSFVAEFGTVGDPHQIIASAWDLEKVRAQYDTFITQFSRIRPSDPVACFRELTLLVHAWRKFPFLDPDIPESLLPPTWPRGRAHTLFADRRDRWSHSAQSFFDALEASVAETCTAA